MFAVSSPRPFDFDAEYGARYDRFIRRVVPGYEQLYPAILSLLAPRVAEGEAQVLVVGTGSGSEILTFAGARPGWRLTGVDPSAQMIAITGERLRERGQHAQVKLHQGYVDELPPESAFDAATLDLVLHFLPDDAGPGGKGELLRQIARRLKPGAPLVLVDAHGAPGSAAFSAQMEGWMRYCAAAGLSAEQVADYRGQVDASIHFVPEARLLELLAEAGFEAPVPFYRFFVFGGWTAVRG